MTESIVRVFADTSTLVRAVAEQFTGAAQRAAASQGRFSVVLAGGGTPQALHELLAQPPYRDRLPWPQMHFFWGDERCVPPEHAESNYGQAWRALLGRMTIPSENIHRIRGEWSPAEAAADYVQQLHACAAPGERWPRFDWVFLGLGADGHTASLFPGSPWPSPLDPPALAVTATYAGRPANRVTLTPQVFDAAHIVAFLVTGASKAAAVTATLAGPCDPQRWPAQRIAPVGGELQWWLDQDAAAGLPASAPKMPTLQELASVG